MIPYFLGSCIGYSAFLLLAGVMHWSESRQVLDEPWIAVALLLVVLPCSTQALAADLTARAMHKRLFDPRAHASYSLIFLGFAVSLGVVCATAVSLAFLHDRISEPLIIATVAACLSAATVALLRRAAPNACVACGYLLSSSQKIGRCTECGAAVTGAAIIRSPCPRPANWTTPRCQS